MAGVVVEFAGGPGTWVTRTYAASLGGGTTLNGKPIRSSGVDKINESLLVGGVLDHSKSLGDKGANQRG